jgi:Flp pilus assembly secretin CpaC
MLQETERRGSAGLPWISEIPILGHLFGVHGTERQETEVAVILVPSRNVPIPDPQDEIPVPRGRFPTARNWIRPSEIRQTLESPEYPWNAF